MATPKRKTVPCKVQIACDGNEIYGSSQMCSRCKDTMIKRKKTGFADIKYWQKENQ